MKKLALITVLAIFASFSLSAQEGNESLNKEKEKQVKEQSRDQNQVKKEKQDTHGQVVSQVAKETPSGPGKGQVVSATASSKSEGKKGLKEKGKKEKKIKAPKEPRDNQNGEVQKGPRDTRPDAAGREAGSVGAKPGKGRR